MSRDESYANKLPTNQLQPLSSSLGAEFLEKSRNMSYREIKNVTDVMRRMGYPRLISLESFRTPNFMLMADILGWFLERYDPNTVPHGPNHLSTEGQRLAFIQHFVQQILRKTGLRLNGRRLYGADGYAVKEIAKVIAFYTKATTQVGSGAESDHSGHKDLLTQFYQLQPSLHKVKVTRDLSAALTEKGVTFYDLITKEVANGGGREAVLAKAFDLRDYDLLLNKSISAVKAEEARLKTTIDAALHTHSSLDLKIQKKRQELERSEQRLETMAKVRPAYMDDFEKLQRELEGLYHQYVARFRILAHLQHQMEDMGPSHQGSKVTKGATRGPLTPRNSVPLNDLSGSEAEEEEDESLESSLERGGPRSEVKKPVTSDPGGRGRSSRKGVLNMYGALEDESSDSDLLLLEGDNSEDLGSEIDDDVDLLLSMRNGPYAKDSEGPNAPPRMRESAKNQRFGPSQSLEDDLGGEGELEAYSEFLNGSSKVKGSLLSEDLDGGGDSLTKPLRPDPRFSSNGRVGREPSPSGPLSGRPSTKKRGSRLSAGKSDRPTTRPPSRVTQLLQEMNEEELE